MAGLREEKGAGCWDHGRRMVAETREANGVWWRGRERRRGWVVVWNEREMTDGRREREIDRMARVLFYIYIDS